MSESKVSVAFFQPFSHLRVNILKWNQFYFIYIFIYSMLLKNTGLRVHVYIGQLSKHVEHRPVTIPPMQTQLCVHNYVYLCVYVNGSGIFHLVAN